ncbi:MAG TPA: NfeD family protein [Polyangiaceae bacterium]|jgi:membrane-bound serine protease (ClpP class)|nr:NfeD family protein [Polyangiaceae bacterium]
MKSVGPSAWASLGRRLWCLLAPLLVLSYTPAAFSRLSYVEVRVSGVINPVKARLVARAVQSAEGQGAELLLVTIDTPGGLVSSMQDIVTALTNCRVPVVTLTEPRSAQATSAGAFVLLAGDVAAMAPGTRLGAAHPVGQGAALDGVLDKKATSALSALIKSLAERRGRPAALAEAMVRDSVSYTAEEAHEKKLVELVVVNRGQLLHELNGRELRAHKLKTSGLVANAVTLTRVERLLDQLAEPTLASLLLSLGVLAILYEFSSPGIGAGGAIGAVLLVLGLLGSSVLELETTALALMAIGFVAIGLEVKVPAHGLLAGTGLMALALGAMLLVDPSQYFGGVRPIRFVLLLPVLLGGGLVVFLLTRATRTALGAPPATGLEALVGKRGTARTAFGPGMEATGQVFVDGARWRAETDEASIRDGEAVEVVQILDKPTRLKVRRVAAEEQ